MDPHVPVEAESLVSEEPARTCDQTRLPDIPVSQTRLSLLQYARRMTKNYLGGFDREVFEKLIVERRYLWFTTVLVNDPDALRRIMVENCANYPRAEFTYAILKPVLGNGLLTTEGAVWRNHRRQMAPVFDPKLLADYATIMAEVVEDYVESLLKLDDGAEIEATRAMMHLTLHIIARTMFSRDSGRLESLIESASRAYHPQMKFSIWGTIPATLPIWARYKRRKAGKVLAAMNHGVRALISERAGIPASQRPNDLLGQLLKAHESKDAMALTLEDVRDEVMTIFVAGHETTALALTWTWCILALIPEEQEKVYQEVREVLGVRPPRHEDLPRLVYTRMFFDEVVRLYPPIHTLGWRQAVQDDYDSGHRIKAGSFISIVPWLLHRHPNLWKDPARFDPQRFSKEQQSSRHRFSYIPFSAGPHVCIGASFAVTEALLIIVNVLRHFRIGLATEKVVNPIGMVTLHPEGPLNVRLYRRDQ